MAEEIRVTGEEAEPAGEAIHLPGPSYQPVLLAAGIALAVIGVVISPILIVIGVVIFLIVLRRWIRATREEIAELPLEH
jgi:Flp pilus assembly protein TadB